jgi:hypothetical protein
MSLPNPNRLARVAAVLYLAIVVTGIFAFFVVRGSLVVPGDAAATAANVVASEGFFRLGIASDLVMILSDVALAVVLYVLFRAVSPMLATFAAFFRLAQSAALGVNLVSLFVGLQLLGPDAAAALGTERAQGLALVFFDAHAVGYTLALLFFAMSLFFLGLLVWRSGFVPKVLGALLIFAGTGYLVDGFANVLLTNYAAVADVFAMVVFLPAIVGELAFALWLLVRGVGPTHPRLVQPTPGFA